MGTPNRIWLVANASSGSNDEEALSLLEQTCGEAGCHVAHRTHFPRYELPSIEMLEAADVTTVAIFAGDGTLNATITHLAGWSGSILVLPGGTMNLLYHRLHGERDMAQVIHAAAKGHTTPVRPAIVRAEKGSALAGLMAGPGTSWNHVREAMRDKSVVEMAEQTVEAFEETVGGAMVRCARPELGRAEGYPLVLLNPTERGIEIVAYHAENAMEFLEQSFALLKRDFREGPHETLGSASELVLQSVDGEPFGLLIDGEPAQTQGDTASFTLAKCEVDLLATQFDD